MFPGSRYGTEIASITEKLNWMKRRFVILTSALLFGSVPFFTENTASPIYGNRLEGIKKVEINSLY